MHRLKMSPTDWLKYSSVKVCAKNNLACVLFCVTCNLVILPHMSTCLMYHPLFLSLCYELLHEFGAMPDSSLPQTVKQPRTLVQYICQTSECQSWCSSSCTYCKKWLGVVLFSDEQYYCAEYGSSPTTFNSTSLQPFFLIYTNSRWQIASGVCWRVWER